MNIGSATESVSDQITKKNFDILSAGLKNAKDKVEEQTNLALVKSVTQPSPAGTLGSNIDVIV